MAFFTRTTTSSSNTTLSSSSSSSWLWRWGSLLVLEYPRTAVLGSAAVAYVAVGTLTLDRRARRLWFRPLTLTASVLTAAVGFVVSLVADVADAVQDGRTAVWQRAMEALQLFLVESGLDDEFSATMASTHFIPALMVLTDLQNKVQRQRRTPLRQQADGRVSPTDLATGAHYMRYATAAYGPQMMASTQLAVYDTTLAGPHESHHDWIAKHVHLWNTPNTTCSSSSSSRSTTPPAASNPHPDNKAAYEIWCDYTRDPTNPDVSHAQHCTVVCDHTHRVVVLTIRGTFSLSGILTDLAGYCTDYCAGRAHTGMARAAQETWDTVWNDILREKMEALPATYALVVTGHSLGAGVACLVTILIYYLMQEKKLTSLEKRRIQCYAMAPPPVFAPLSAAPQAVANTIAYIHQYDCVPSLSVDSVRRLMACLDRIQNVLSRHPVWEIAAKRWELGEPQPELLEAYEQPKEPLRELAKAPMLFIPARQLVWLEKQVDDDGQVTGYEAHALDPTFYADRVLDLELPDCVADHLTSEYETAFAKLLGSGQFGVTNNDTPSG